ncbi:MarR family winged helix-turn-helix transcriptional regulator [Egicoccus sp. AB-alg2]|uniref:MarR family winged helix-turn-helix transcriptional regulator n=1 Tax=Egicoccus sp. AB-alg2 TaxID=3242693 RepID=UPI00359CF96F
MTNRVEAYRRLVADVYELAGISRETSETLASEVGQTAARWHVMSAISEQALPVPAIARRLGLARQSVQRVIDDLAASGLVTTRPNPEHRRSPLFSLSEEGQAVTEELFRRSEASRAELLRRARVSTDDLEGARRVLRALVAAFES